MERKIMREREKGESELVCVGIGLESQKGTVDYLIRKQNIASKMILSVCRSSNS